MGIAQVYKPSSQLVLFDPPHEGPLASGGDKREDHTARTVHAVRPSTRQLAQSKHAHKHINRSLRLHFPPTAVPDKRTRNMTNLCMQHNNTSRSRAKLIEIRQRTRHYETTRFRHQLTLSLSNSGLEVVSKRSPVNIEFAPAMNIIACSSRGQKRGGGRKHGHLPYCSTIRHNVRLRMRTRSSSS